MVVVFKQISISNLSGFTLKYSDHYQHKRRLCCSERAHGNFFKLDLNINIKSVQGEKDSASPNEAVSESAKWREAGSPGKGWGMGAPIANIRQGRVTSVGTASVSSSHHHQGPSRSGEGCSAQIPARRLQAPPGACRSRVAAKDTTAGEQMQHLALKDKTKQNNL